MVSSCKEPYTSNATHFPPRAEEEDLTSLKFTLDENGQIMSRFGEDVIKEYLKYALIFIWFPPVCIVFVILALCKMICVSTFDNVDQALKIMEYRPLFLWCGAYEVNIKYDEIDSIVSKKRQNVENDVEEVMQIQII